MKNFITACCACLFLAALGSGCVTRTQMIKGVTNINGRPINNDDKCISKQTIWIWQKEFWRRSTPRPGP
jgi:hypothetical protein